MITIRRISGEMQLTLMAMNNRLLHKVKSYSASENFRKVKPVAVIFLWAAGLLVFFAFMFYMFTSFVPAASELSVKRAIAINPGIIETNDDENSLVIAAAQKELEILLRKYDAMTPRQHYLVINTTENHFYLYQNKTIVREGFVSTGSNIRLQTGDNREWVFKTPKGKHTVKNKITSPVWKKPDWAFIEDGLPVPPQNHSSRFEYGSLGDYALNLGDGYLIHGTLYKRLLGMPVTHGCIRLNDEDLEYIYKSLNPGSKVYIF